MANTLTPTLPAWRRYHFGGTASLGTCCVCMRYLPYADGIRGRDKKLCCHQPNHESILSTVVHMLCVDCAIATGRAFPVAGTQLYEDYND